MVSAPVRVAVAVMAVVEDNIGFAGGGLAGCVVGTGNPRTSAGTAGTAHSDIGPDTAGIAHSHIGPGTSGTVRFGTGPDTSGIVRSGTDSDTCPGIGFGRCWVVYLAQIHSIVVVDMMADPGIAQAERNSAACTLPAGASIWTILVGQTDELSPSLVECKLEAEQVRPQPGLGSFSRF